MPIILEYGDSVEGRDMTNPVGSGVKAQSFYADIREIIKRHFECSVGPVMTNKIVCFVPASQELEGYQSRSEVIEMSMQQIAEYKETQILPVTTQYHDN